MRRGLYAILLVTLFATFSEAGYVGEINLGSANPDTNAALAVSGTGANSTLQGTGLQAPSVTSAGGTMTSLTGGYLFFTTGTYAGTNAQGDTLYNGGGDFFVLQNNVMQSTPVYAKAYLTTGPATVTTLTGMFENVGGVNKQEYELTMGFSGGTLNSPIYSLFGAPASGTYTGTFQMIFIQDSSLAGNQLISGNITFNLVPEPSSYAMVLIGGLGLFGFGRRRLRRAA
jgi:hypothetical protein